MHGKSTLILIHLVNYESRKSVDWTDFAERLAAWPRTKNVDPSRRLAREVAFWRSERALVCIDFELTKTEIEAVRDSLLPLFSLLFNFPAHTKDFP
jgi:hypothetical protein